MLHTRLGRQLVPQMTSSESILDMPMTLLRHVSLPSILVRAPQGREIIEMIRDMPQSIRIRRDTLSILRLECRSTMHMDAVSHFVLPYKIANS